MFAEAVLMLRHCPHFQELGTSRQRRDVSEIIHKKFQKSRARLRAQTQEVARSLRCWLSSNLLQLCP